MPLAQTRDVFHASVAWFDCQDVGTATIYKRFCEGQSHLLDTPKQKIDISRGLYRAYAMRMPYIPAKTATFYVRGDLKETLRLLSYLPGLGKKVAYGYGMYRSVSVEETLGDCSLVKDGVAMRPLPLAMFNSLDQMMLAYKPPYWDKRSVAPCVPPGAKLIG